MKCCKCVHGLRCRDNWYCGPPNLNTVGLMLRIACSKCGNSFMLVTEDCCSTYWLFNSLELKITFDGCSNFAAVANHQSNQLTYMWSELVCSSAWINCLVSASSFIHNKFFASSATRGWNSSDLLSGVPTDESDIGSSLSTEIAIFKCIGNWPTRFICEC